MKQPAPRAKKARPSTKLAGRPAKPAGRVAKPAGRPAKPAGRVAKPAGRAAKPAARPAADVPPARINVPSFPVVELATPGRTGRVVNNRLHAADEAERRLRLAWYFRADLDPALPGGAAFHPVAWTALGILRNWLQTNDAHTSAARATALQTLVTSVGVVREIVRRTTAIGSPAREHLRFEIPLRPDGTLLAHADAIIAGARAVRASFPALTDRVLVRADAALAAAHAADQASRHGHEAHDLNRIQLGDRAQLALDVLLDAVDHLGAAATSQFLPERPIAAHYFTAPLEPHAHAPASLPVENPPPAAAPATAHDATT